MAKWDPQWCGLRGPCLPGRMILLPGTGFFLGIFTNWCLADIHVNVRNVTWFGMQCFDPMWPLGIEDELFEELHIQACHPDVLQALLPTTHQCPAPMIGLSPCEMLCNASNSKNWPLQSERIDKHRPISEVCGKHIYTIQGLFLKRQRPEESCFQLQAMDTDSE